MGLIKTFLSFVVADWVEKKAQLSFPDVLTAEEWKEITDAAARDKARARQKLQADLAAVDGGDKGQGDKT